jgi:hypothetical protein
VTGSAMETDFNIKVIGSILAVAGILTSLYGGFGHDRQTTMLNMGSVHATAAPQHNVPLSPIVGGFALLGGIVLFVLPRRKQA